MSFILRVVKNILPAFFLVLSLYVIPTANAASMVIYPEADTFVQGGSGVNNNFGSSATLTIKGIDYRMAYLRFDLSSMPPDVQSVKLTLTGTGCASMRAAFVPVDTWDEMTMNYISKPAAAEDLANAVLLSGKVQFDLTQKAIAEMGEDKKLSVMIYNSVEDNINYNFNSREAASGMPALEYDTPQPVATVTANNMITNPGFELDSNGDGIPDGWTPYTIGQGTASLDNTAARNGIYGAKGVCAASDDEAGYTSDYLNIVSQNRTYQFTAFVKTASALQNGSYASFKITFASKNDGKNDIKTIESDHITDTAGGWSFINIEVVAPDNTLYVKVRVSIKGTGTAWFDDINCEEKILHNLLPNPSAEFDAGSDGMPDNWTASAGASWDLSVSYGGTHSFGLTPTATNPLVKWHSDMVPVFTGERYTYSAKLKADAVGGAYLQFDFFDVNGGYIRGYTSSSISGSTTGWTDITGGQETPYAAAAVRVSLCAVGSGSAWFDDIVFTKNSFNRLLNPGGEYNDALDAAKPEGWSKKTFSGTGNPDMSTSTKYAGAKGFRVATSGDCGWVSDRVAIKGGMSYKYGGYMKTTTGSTGKASIRLSFYDASGNYITQACSQELTGATNFTMVEDMAAAPQNAATAEVELRFTGGGSAYFDQAKLEGPILQHPYLLFDSSDIQAIQQKWDSEPFKTAYNSLNSDLLRYIKTRNTTYAANIKNNVIISQLNNLMKTARPGGGYTSERAGRRMQDWACEFDIIKDSGVISPHEEEEIRRMFIYLANAQLNSEYGDFSRNNRNVDRYAGIGIVGLVFPEYTLSDFYIDHAKSCMTDDLNTVVKPDGTWPETTRYVNVVAKTFAGLAKVLQRHDGTYFYDNPKFKSIYKTFFEVRTPADSVLAGGYCTAPAIGDASWGEVNYSALGWIAPEYKTTDPDFSRLMMSAWKKGGSSFESGNLPYGMLYIDPSLPDSAPELASQLQPDIGYAVFRSGADTANENYFIMHVPPTNYFHRHYDVGSFSIYSDGVPIMLDSGMGDYNDTVTAPWYDSTASHNAICFKSPDGNLVNGADVGAAVKSFYTSRLADYVKVGIPDAMAKRYDRQAIFLKGGFNVYVVFDSIDSVNKSVSNLHTLSTSSTVSGNRVDAQCYGGKNVEIDFLLPQNATVQKSSGIFSAAAIKGLPAPPSSQEYFAVEAGAGEEHLAVIYPKKTADPNLAISQLATSDSAVKAYKAQKGDNFFIISANTSADAKYVDIDSDVPLADVVTGVVYPSVNGKVNILCNCGEAAVLTSSDFYTANQEKISLFTSAPQVVNNGRDVRLCISAENNLDVTKQAVIIAVMYNGGGRLMQIRLNPVTIGRYSSVSTVVDFDCPPNAGYCCKAFVWNNTASVQPLGQSKWGIGLNE